jgi:type I restriction enzyme, S subunit
MANVSSSNGLEKRPKLRFPGFDEPYKQCRIGDIYAERSQRGASDMELLSVTMNDGVKPRSEIEGKDNSSEDKSNYKIVRKGDMVYNSMRMWQGANGISPCDGIVSPAYTVLMPKQGINNGYFAALFKSANLINEFRKNSQGMTSDTWNLKYPQIETIKVQVPSVSEQDKVSEMFGVLDERIAAQSQLVESLKKYKRGVVDGIFSRKLNFSYPQTWAELEISELFMPISDKGYSDKIVLTIVQGEGTMPRDSVDRRIAYDKSTISSYKRVLPNDFILHLRSFEGGLEIVNEEGVVSPAYTILRARNEIIPLFFYTFFRSYWFINSKLRISVEGIRDGKSINMNTFWHIKVPVPSIEEQRRISALISSIDNRIKIAEFEYKRLLQIRVGLMQQLFI